MLIKTYLRTSMQEDRLNALALLYINKDIKLDYSQVIDQFPKGNLRLNLKYTDFVFWSLIYALRKFFITTVRFLCLIFILRFHSFTDKIASHVADWLLGNLTQVTMNTRKNLRLA